jgi:uncharacterized protein with PhoU and TrkA domain
MKDLVSLMKKSNNILEVMNHLSYSSIFLTDKNMAKMTLELDEEFKKARDDIYRLTFSLKGVKKEALITITDIVETTSDLADSFSDRAQIVLGNREVHPVLKKVVEEDDKRAFVVNLREGCSLNGKTLLETEIKQKTGAMVLAIKRDKWLIAPVAKDKLMANDVLVCLGDKKTEELLKKISMGTVRI